VYREQHTDRNETQKTVQVQENKTPNKQNKNNVVGQAI